MGKKLKLGIVGCGARANNVVKSELFRLLDQIEIVALCDLYEKRVQNFQEAILEKTGYSPKGTTDYNELLDMGVDAVYIACAWEDHINVAVQAMKKGVYVGMEVGGAYSIEDCWRLINTYEETKVPVFLLENCCYGKKELMTLNMARQGFFGDIVHVDGAYCHDLRGELLYGKDRDHYRYYNYIKRNCENYPTHALVPLGKVLKIGDGNRIVSLTSTASCAKGLHKFALEKFGPDDERSKIEYKQGDVITTVMKCANGETIRLTLDTSLPRAYSRGYTIHGTSAAFFEDTNMIFEDKKHKHAWSAEEFWGNAKEYEEEYLHPLWRGYDASGGHGGMDYLLFSAFVEFAKAKAEPPIDAYDTATYMAVTALSEESISKGSAPVYMPDFTTGRWYKKPDRTFKSKYDL